LKESARELKRREHYGNSSHAPFGTKGKNQREPERGRTSENCRASKAEKKKGEGDPAQTTKGKRGKFEPRQKGILEKDARRDWMERQRNLQSPEKRQREEGWGRVRRTDFFSEQEGGDVRDGKENKDFARPEKGGKLSIGRTSETSAVSSV